MTPDRPSRRTSPPAATPSSTSRDSLERLPGVPQRDEQPAENKPREPWVEQWLADEEDDVWNMPCTD